MKYLKKFETHEEYLAFLQSSDYKKPNVSFCVLQEEVHYGKFIPNPHMTIELDVTSTPVSGTSYDIGEYVTYEFTVVNDGDVDLTNITVGCGSNVNTIQSLSPGESELVNFIPSINVTEGDILNGGIILSAQATSEYTIPTVVDIQDTNGVSYGSQYTFEVAEPKPSMSISSEVTSHAYNYDGYVPGESIYYDVTVTNDGNLTLTNVIVGGNTIDSLAPEETVELVDEEYVVTATDEVNEEAVIHITASASNQSNIQTPIAEDEISEPVMHDYSQDYFTIESLEDGNEIGFMPVNTNPANAGSTYYYSTDDGVTWQQGVTSNSWASSSRITINANEKVLFKSLVSINQRHYDKLHGTKSYVCYGNIMSLAYGDNFIGQTTVSENGQFRRLFSSESNLMEVHNLVLPLTSLPAQCFYATFKDCTSIVKSPVLPNSTLPQSTISSPSDVYKQTFNSCSSLNYVKSMISEYPFFNFDFQDWLTGTQSNGTFLKPASVIIPSSTYLPSTWTIVNIEDL